MGGFIAYITQLGISSGADEPPQAERERQRDGLMQGNVSTDLKGILSKQSAQCIFCSSHRISTFLLLPRVVPSESSIREVSEHFSAFGFHVSKTMVYDA